MKRREGESQEAFLARRHMPVRPGRIRAWLRHYVIGISTTSGRVVDLVIIGMIILAVTALILESVPAYNAAWGNWFHAVELLAGLVFVLEYIARVWTASNAFRYMRSFWGIVDLLAILPLLLSGFDLQFLRTFRLLRVFSILKVVGYTKASATLIDSLIQARTKIGVFLFAVCVLVLIISFTMHLLEPHKFTTIPDAIWWTIVTITTVGYGDYVPASMLGKVLAAFTMLTAFGIIAVPTGIIAVEIRNQGKREEKVLSVHHVRCRRCGQDEHLTDARYCRRCAEPLFEATPKPKSADDIPSVQGATTIASDLQTETQTHAMSPKRRKKKKKKKK